ncbi:MAG: histidine kinase, partial [Gramella sp.]|nr:histidine kinase [Christiangramia sp.]
MLFNSFKTLIFIGLLGFVSYSQELVPPIQNYLPAEYEAASQNWDIALDKRGVVYIANNQGLLVYDGLSWELFSLDSQSIIRSVLPYDGRIYTGSYEEFGYWEVLKDGQMQYISLKPLLKDYNLQSDEFWEITAYNGAIYFRSFGGIFKYQDNQIVKLKEVVSTALTVYKENLIYSTKMNGLGYIKEIENLKIFGGDLTSLNGIDIVDLETRGDSLFIAGRKSLYLYYEGELKQLGNARLKELMERSELNHIKSISQNELILGTIKNGIVHYDLLTDKFQVYNRKSGLQNNTILGMAYNNQRMWLALDKGIDMIDLHAPIEFYTDNSGELGAVYDLCKSNGTYYLATNTGGYTFAGSSLRLLKNSGDHTWNLEEIGGVLYANHNSGFYRIDNQQFIPLDTRTGSFSVGTIDNKIDSLILLHYTGVSLYDARK